MVWLLCWFGILSAGSVLGAAVWKKRYEEVLPITCSAIVMLLFLFCLCKNLKLGVMCICILGGLAYVFSGIWVVYKRSLKEFFQNLVTPAFFVWCVLFIIFCCLDRGKLASSWDEFSHWADIVKAMTTLDDFGTNPASQSIFQSYPPAMSLFQYFLQKIFIGVTGNEYNEWIIYISYKMFYCSFLMPFFKGLNYKKPFMILVSGIVVFLAPSLFYDNIYTAVYIDPFLGILSGAGLAMVFLTKEKDIWYSLRIVCICVVLVLSKDAGVMFAIFIAIAYVCDSFFSYEQKNRGSRKWWKKQGFTVLGTILVVLLPKMLWSLHLKVSNANIMFSGKVNLRELLQIVLDKDTTYKRIVWEKYYTALVARTVTIGNTGITLNYFVLMLLFIIFIWALIVLYRKRDSFYQKKGRILMATICIQFVVYIVGICITYIFKFGKYEATLLASFDRYIEIGFLAVWIVIIMLILTMTQEYCKEQYLVGLVMIFVLTVVSPMEAVHNYTWRNTIETSVSIREQYVPLTTKVKQTVPETAKIYFISQESNGFDYYVMRYNLRPNHMNSANTWSIGETFYEGDIWTRGITPEKWMEELVQSYDYVAIYNLNDYFIENFSVLFDNAEGVEGNCVYRVNKETKILEKCN